jgi:hypothetical protein
MEVNKVSSYPTRMSRATLTGRLPQLTHIALVLLKMDMRDMALRGTEMSVRLSAKRTATCLHSQYALIYHHQGTTSKLYVLPDGTVEKAMGQAWRPQRLHTNVARFKRWMELAVDSFKALSINTASAGESHPTCARTLNEIGSHGVLCGYLRITGS